MSQTCGVSPAIAQSIRESLYPSARARGEKVRWMQRLARESGEGCRDWPWALTSKGYGTISWDGVSTKVGHVILAMTGQQRPDGLIMLHSCDRPACVAPWHLRWGTYAENGADREARGRGRPPKGMKNGVAKLTDADVLAIRAAKGLRTQRDLAQEYGVHFTVINKIMVGKTWRHLLPDEEGSCPAV